jgi:hypothetical protein
MATSEVQICNLAIRAISLTPISALSERSPEAEDCTDFYPQCRDSILEQHPWNFASTRKELTPATLPAAWSQYEYAYRYPNDCVAARKLFLVGGTVEQNFIVAENEDGVMLVLTDAPTAILEYTKREEDVKKFSALFVECLSSYLASKLAGSRLKDVNQEQAQLTRANNALAAAQRRDSKEGEPEEVDEVPWVLARLKENNWG